MGHKDKKDFTIAYFRIAMALHHEIGQKGEQTAKEYLLQKGYEILATNFRFQRAEIDIIAQHKRTIVFVEVKTRSSDFSAPEQAVHKPKQRLIQKAADEYLYQNGLKNPVRFDIIAVHFYPSSTKIYHMEDAFYPRLN